MCFYYPCVWLYIMISKEKRLLRPFKKRFLLKVMRWARRDDGTFEVIDGQQRTIFVCQYINRIFSYSFQFFENFTKEEQYNILNYKIKVYVCEGTDKEEFDCFRVINIAGI